MMSASGLSPIIIAAGATLVACLAVAGSPLSPAAADEKPRKGFVPTSSYSRRTIGGWRVRVNRRLFKDEKALGDRALRLLDNKLFEITRSVPEKALKQIQQVTIWLGVDDGHAPCAEYHPSKQWLIDNGYNPDKAKCVEIGNATRFLAWSHDQPAMVLHELAHAYHDQFLGFDHPEVKAAYEAAKEAGRYESVLRFNGKTERHYALTNPVEYFAEATEAYYGANDFYPFVRAELKRHDPRMHDLLGELWDK